MPSLIESADALWRRGRASPLLWRFTLFTRLLLAAGFVPTGLVKLVGRRFVHTVTTDPIGAFFEAMYQTGGYWQFIGASQVVAGLLLLLPATAYLGAALFLPILVNILVIVVSLGFGGTPLPVALMLLAVLWLLLWDLHRFRGLLSTTPPVDPRVPVPVALDRMEWVGFAVFGVSLMAFCLATRSFLPMAGGRWWIVAGCLGGMLALGRTCWRFVGSPARDDMSTG